ncbi:hypothetical protein YK56LOC_60970 [Caballeronia sp. HLA56]
MHYSAKRARIGARDLQWGLPPIDRTGHELEERARQVTNEAGLTMDGMTERKKCGSDRRGDC